MCYRQALPHGWAPLRDSTSRSAITSLPGAWRYVEGETEASKQLSRSNVSTSDPL
jgi:hypothetical protein